MFRENPQPIATPQAAAHTAHEDAAHDYREPRSVTCPTPVRYLKQYPIEPFGSFTAVEIRKTYLFYYTGTWNAMLGMDEAAAKAEYPDAVLRKDFAKLPRLA